MDPGASVRRRRAVRSPPLPLVVTRGMSPFYIPGHLSCVPLEIPIPITL